MSLRSPLGQARGLGSAKDGVHHWWMQRVTAVALVPLSIWFVAAVIAGVGSSHAEAVAFLGDPWVAIPMILLVIAGFHHSALGMRVVIEDYVHREGAKIACLLFVQLGLFALGVAAIFAVVKISLGA